MAGKIPDETLQAIRERVSLVEVVSGHVTLKKAGRNFLGLCPFHSEKTPSFTVNNERGLFHCFGCGAGGTVFTFVMRAERLSFPEAVEMLAQRAGVALPRHSGRTDGDERRQHLLAINEIAQRCFRVALCGGVGAPARRYLEQRQVSADIVERYGIGFCPAQGAGLAQAIGVSHASMDDAGALGLFGTRTNGSPYERFWGRITFPIRDGSGRILGFGGRTLGTSLPKYLNSPESALFHKGEVLYGLFESRQAIREAERIVIVEGYLDALALVEAGIGYTVASLGTALTATQLRQARRFAPEVVLFFDGDRAGQEAAVRAFAVCADTGVWGLGAFLTQGFDPDTFVRTHGVAATVALLEKATPLADFFLLRHDPGAGATVPERARAAERVGQVIARVRDPVHFSILAQRAAQRLGVDESVFRNLRGAAHAGAAPAPMARDATDAFRSEEATLLRAMTIDRDVAILVARRRILDAFHSPVLANAGRAILAAWDAPDGVLSALDELPVSVRERVAADMLGHGDIAAADHVQLAQDCVRRIEQRTELARRRELRIKVQAAEASGDLVRVREHLREVTELLRRREGEHG